MLWPSNLGISLSNWHNILFESEEVKSTLDFFLFQWFPGGFLFDLTTNQKFDIVIMVVIMLNMLTMTMEHYNQSKTFTDVLYWVNFSFIVIFTAECIMKLLALRLYYFKIPWNVFDFVVVVLSVLGRIYL